MQFRIQYFGHYDLLLYAEEVDAEMLDGALERLLSALRRHRAGPLRGLLFDANRPLVHGALSRPVMPISADLTTSRGNATPLSMEADRLPLIQLGA